MATYLVGDVQGCLDELQQLLVQVHFDPVIDELWLTGDLVARGPKSLETLRFVKSLGRSVTTVLGNHDLHLLSVASGLVRNKKRDNLDPLLTAPDRDLLLDWLRAQPLLAVHPQHNFMMVHAGISPQWSQTQAVELAREVEEVIRGEQLHWLLENMYGNMPAHWCERLQGIDRYRMVLNVFTRMRYCFPDGELELGLKKHPTKNSDPNLLPWFEVEGEHLNGMPVVFGHWASLMGETQRVNPVGLDTGCVWGNALTMLRWEDKARFTLACPVYAD